MEILVFIATIVLAVLFVRKEYKKIKANNRYIWNDKK